MGALGKQESSGHFDSVNVDTGAHGKWQVMPANWPKWSKEAGLPADAEKSPENQRIVVRHKLIEYFVAFGSWDNVARAWYSGPADHDRHSEAREGHGKYPSVNSYARGVMRNVGSLPCDKTKP